MFSQGLFFFALLTFLKIYLSENEEFSITEELFSKNNYTEAATHYEHAIQASPRIINPCPCS